MKQERNIARGIKVVGGLIFASNMLLSGVSSPRPAKENTFSPTDSSPPNTLSIENFLSSLEIDPPQTPTPVFTPSPQPTEALPSPTPEPTVDYLAMSKVISEMQKRPDVFSKRVIEDVEIYYPIYKAVGDKYGLKWYLLWIVHEAESTASIDPKAFERTTGPVGAMQINLSYHNVDHAGDGLEYLATLLQRHPNDWKDIAGGASILARSIKNYSYLHKDLPIEVALERYASVRAGEYRFAIYEEYKKIFD